MYISSNDEKDLYVMRKDIISQGVLSHHKKLHINYVSSEKHFIGWKTLGVFCVFNSYYQEKFCGRFLQR